MTVTRYTRPHQTRYIRGWERDYNLSMTTAVCFKCRIHNNGKICQFCNEPMVNLGKFAKIPKKNDTRGWLKLAEVYWRRLVPNEFLESLQRSWNARCTSPNSLLFNEAPIKPKSTRTRKRRRR